MPKTARLRPDDDFPKLHFLIEQRAATIPLLHRTLFAHCKSETSVNEWLKRMRALGYVESALHCITPRGHIAVRATDGVHRLAVPGSDYSDGSGNVTHGTLPHTLAVAEIAARWYRSPGHRVLSERYLQHQKQLTLAGLARSAPRLGAPLTRFSTRREAGYGLHLADLILEAPTSRIAVEVELNPKDVTYYEDLFRGYLEAIDAGHLQGVQYVVPEAGSSISSAAMRQRIWDGADAALRHFDATRNVNPRRPALWQRPVGVPPLRAQDFVWVLPHRFLYDTKR